MPASAQWQWDDNLYSNKFAGGARVSAMYNGELYVAGGFKQIPGSLAWGIAKWDGQSWTSLPELWYSLSPAIIHSMAIFDEDGPGGNPPALFVGGQFNSLVKTSNPGTTQYNGIIKWDGTQWVPLSSGGFQSSFVSASSLLTGAVATGLKVYNDGTGDALYACGNFKTVDDTIVNGIAKWDGTEWSPMADGVIVSNYTTVWDLEVFNNELYVCGDFISNSSGSLIKRWDVGLQLFRPVGPSQAASNGGVTTAMYEMEPYSGSLYVRCKAFEQNSTVLRWNGSAWSQPIVAPDPMVANSLDVYNDGSGAALFIGREIALPGWYSGDSSAYATQVVTKWNGTTQRDIGQGIANTGTLSPELVKADLGQGERLYNLGIPTYWTGSTWARVGDVGEGGGYGGLLSVDPDGAGPLPSRLYAVHGASTFGSQMDAHPDWTLPNRGGPYVGYFDSEQWTRIGESFIAEYDKATHAYGVATLSWANTGSGGELYATGSFRNVGGSSARYDSVARWNGSSWQPVGTGGVTVGEGCSPCGAGSVIDAVVFDPDGNGPLRERLVIAGNFDHVGGVPANRIAMWDGTNWSALGSGLDAICRLEVQDFGSGPLLIAVNDELTNAGGVTVSSIAQWNPAISTWSPMGAVQPTPIFNEPVRAIKAFTDAGIPSLCITGNFIEAGGVPCKGVARWNGTSWSAMDTGIPFDPVPSANHTIQALAVWDNGTGPALYAGIYRATGEFVVAKWTGTQWEPLTAGNGLAAKPLQLYPTIDELCPIGSGPGSSLYVGGNFGAVDGVRSDSFARWFDPSAAACPADFNGDSVRDVADLFAYINAWLAKTPSADFNDSGTVDVADLFAYINAWLAGC